MPLADDPDLSGWEPGGAHHFADSWLEHVERWGSGLIVDGWDPALASPRNYRQVGMLERTAASRAVARAYVEAAMRTDVSRIAAQVQCPVRVLHTPTNRMPEAVSRHAAELFPKGEFRVLRPSEPGMSWGESFSSAATGSCSTAWRSTAEGWSMGSGTARCALPGPAIAIHWAERLHELVRPLDLRLRIGIHTGECVRIGNDLEGLTVHVAARIGAAAAPGETLVSRAVSDLVAGSGLGFASRGVHQLKGVPGDWELLAAFGEEAAPTVPAQPPQPRLGDRLIVTTARRAPRLLTALNRLDSALSRRRS